MYTLNTLTATIEIKYRILRATFFKYVFYWGIEVSDGLSG